MSSSPAKICMNGLCGTTTTPQWKRAWALKIGGFATLCYSCGIAYEKINYCERFHLNEPGWRECEFCKKPIHCGCVVSRYLHEYLDHGGITCTICLRSKQTQPLKQPIINNIPTSFPRFSNNWPLEKRTLTQFNEALDKHQKHVPPTPFIGHHFRQEENRLPLSESNTGFSSSKNAGAIVSYPSPLATMADNSRPKAVHEPPPQQSLGFSLGPLEGRVEGKIPDFKVQKSRLVFPKTSKSGVSVRASDNRAAKPPADGRGRSQLLPRYQPKITDQELLQISGDLNSNCTITPLFEKVLSASDAGRIGRLVLPKACAEAYFPTINQSEGLPIKIRDIKGKEWTFQFRFWPNNNSRMYVLEGVTPCIQNMQMQAGDTVIFSRLDPEGKLVIGCRKAAISAEDKAETSALPNLVNDDTPIYENPLTKKTEHEKKIQEKKKMRNIGSKNKRLHMHGVEAMKLKFTWDETQEFIQPSPNNKPTVSMIDDCEIEEYNEPPAFGKKTIFTMTATGSQEQWLQCDNCSKRRKLPTSVLVPQKWTCSDNVSDPDRCSCLAPEEKKVGDLDQILIFSKGSKKRKPTDSRATIEQQPPEPSGLEALATAAVLGESGGNPTTRHPRHRPGCSCIVCIQPPSGKGKHRPGCNCNVCSTVKRRFRTLMQRKQNLLPETQTSPESGAGIVTGIGSETMGESSSNKGQGLDLNCDPRDEEMTTMEWRNVHAELVPKGTSDTNKDDKVVGGS